MATNAGQLSTNSHNLLTTWSHKVTKKVINSLSRDPWLSNVTEEWLMIRSHISNSKVTYSSDYAVT